MSHLYKRQTISSVTLSSSNERRYIMPVITVQTGPLSKEKKKEFTQLLTEVSMKITGAPIGFHQVYISEYPYDSMSAGNKTVEEIVKAMQE